MNQTTSGGGTIRILVVEDNAPDVMLIGEALQEQGIEFELTHFRDGEEALDRISNSPPEDHEFDLAVLDLNMPRVSGLEVLEKMKQKPAFAQLPVLILTSSLAPDEQSEAFRLGATKYLKKPADLYEFLEQIGNVVRELVPRTMSADGHK